MHLFDLVTHGKTMASPEEVAAALAALRQELLANFTGSLAKLQDTMEQVRGVCWDWRFASHEWH